MDEVADAVLAEEAAEAEAASVADAVAADLAEAEVVEVVASENSTQAHRRRWCRSATSTIRARTIWCAK